MLHRCSSICRWHQFTCTCSCIRALNRKLEFCNSFAYIYHIKCNSRQFIRIKFDKNLVNTFFMLLVILLNGPVMLDTYVNADLIDKTD